MPIAASMTDTDIRSRAHTLLRNVFGYEQFRGQQEEIIAHVMSGGDAFVLMPTGSGKSLCFQIPAMLRDGVGVVISPLIALMQDQVNALQQMGVRAAFLNSTLSPEAAREVEQQVLAGNIDLVYIAPERLTAERTLALLAKCSIALFAIDEAHCVSQWGHDFRADYLQLSVLHEHFPMVPRIALTATADELTRREIINRLQLTTARTFITGFDRPNIRYRVALKHNTKKQIHEFLTTEHPHDSGIIYCLSRRKTEELAAWLSNEGWHALPYHAGLDAATRQQHQDTFQREDSVVMVATIAFGMGIDKPDVRFVLHADIPKSLEAYYQETGRAGRDGLPADALMLYGLGDVTLMRQILAQSEADEAHKRIELQKLNALLGFCETPSCRRQVILGYFGETRTEPCGNCDTCLEPVETWDGTLAARKALYCMYQTGQRFGVMHLCDILTGNATPRVQQYRHDQLSAFGGGSDIPGKEWSSIFRQLVAMGYCNVDKEGKGSLLITPSGMTILKGETTVRLRKDPLPHKKRKERNRRVTDVISLETSAEQGLWEVLRATRRQIAEAAGVPPFVIFHDSTLREMVVTHPTTLDEMSGISGIGTQKLTKYGQRFLDVIAQYGEETAR
ncbi:MAG TPA: DNA helicase RecQ [Armatimonadota bacterium]|nr:DNA helicase RecQ [Armatimonadota bacterium]